MEVNEEKVSPGIGTKFRRAIQRRRSKQGIDGDRSTVNESEEDEMEDPELESQNTSRSSKEQEISVPPPTNAFLESATEGISAQSPRPSTANSSIRVTGFAVASAKRNREFHVMFRSVPSDDYLIDDYGCALQREILVHGRMYVSEGHICFNSNIFGWVTNLVIAFSEIVAIEKKSTAVIFPNAITITTLQQTRHIFASFISRDTTYDLIIKIWRLSYPGSGYPNLGLNDSDISDYESDHSRSAEESDALSDGSPPKITRSAKNSQILAPKPTPKEQATPPEIDSSIIPSEHQPTELCDEHLEKSLVDDIIPASMDKVWNLIFGDNTSWLEAFLLYNQKNTELEISGFQGSKSRPFSFVKHLSASIGPKQTRCNITETIEQFSPERISVISTTHTPDVPNGNSFTVKTKYSLSWAESNQTRFKSSYSIEWAKSSWLKAPIEKGVGDGQISYSKDLVEALKKEFGMPPKKKRKVKGGTPTEDIQQLRPQKLSLVWTIWHSTRVFLSNLPISLFSTLGIILLLLVIFFLVRIERSLSMIKSGTFEENWKLEEQELWNWLDRRGIEIPGKPAILLDSSMKKREIASAINSLERRLDELKRRQEL